MALRYLLDENLRGPLWLAVQRHNARGEDVLDAARVGDDPGLPLGTPDADLLLWCERQGRILITLDRSTMAPRLEQHLEAGHHVPGVFCVRPRRPVPEVLDFLTLAAYAGERTGCWVLDVAETIGATTNEVAWPDLTGSPIDRCQRSGTGRMPTLEHQRAPDLNAFRRVELQETNGRPAGRCETGR